MSNILANTDCSRTPALRPKISIKEQGSIIESKRNDWGKE